MRSGVFLIPGDQRLRLVAVVEAGLQRLRLDPCQLADAAQVVGDCGGLYFSKRLRRGRCLFGACGGL